MDAKFKEITPVQAAVWLERGGVNRKINSTNLAKCVDSIGSESWAHNGETIKFSKSGRLLDGQHRLSACVQTGKIFWSLVVTGLDEDVFTTIDSGKRRSLSDVLTVNGEENTGLLAKSLTLLEAYELGVIAQHVGFRKGTAHSRKLVLDRHPGLRDVVGAVASLSTKTFRKPSIAVGVYLAGLNDPTVAAEMFKKLKDGTNLSATDPMLVLRNKLFAFQGLTRGSRIPDSFTAAVVFKGINAYFAKAEVSQIRYAVNMPFPSLLNFPFGKPVDAARALAKTKRGLVLVA